MSAIHTTASSADPAAQSAIDEERRRAARMRTLKRAKVIFNKGFSTLDCVVRNISATGALLTVDEAAHLPKEFEIRIGEESVVRPGTLVYRRGIFAGIRFSDVEADLGAKAAGRPQGGEQTEPTKLEAVAGDDRAPGVHRIVPETLPAALAGNFPWARG